MAPNMYSFFINAGGISTSSTTYTDSTYLSSFPTIYEDCDTTYVESYGYTINQPDFKKIKKLLKRMQDEMCKHGWVEPKPYCEKLLIKPISLRGVCYSGRGWAN